MKNMCFALLAGVAVVASPRLVNAQTKDPCAMLTTTEMQQAFPGTKAGRLDRKLEKDGILTCEWVHATGRVVLIAGNDAPEDSPVDEAKTLMAAFVDPTRPDAERRVRIETLAGVGDKAVAILELKDPAKGFTENGALLVVRRGQRQVVLLAVPPGDFARRERADALKALSELGKAIAKRLG
jgi:hypothetical protein